MARHMIASIAVIKQLASPACHMLHLVTGTSFHLQSWQANHQRSKATRKGHYRNNAYIEAGRVTIAGMLIAKQDTMQGVPQAT